MVILTGYVRWCGSSVEVVDVMVVVVVPLVVKSVNTRR